MVSDKEIDASLMKTQRKEEWFDNEKFWRELELYMFPEHRFADAAASLKSLLRLAKPKGKAVLDLCCGPGRWTIPLAKHGFHVTAVDRTAHLLRRAQARAGPQRARIEWVRQDMRDFVRPNSFDLVLSMLTSFGYFDDPQEDLAVLGNIHTSLRPGGVVFMEMAGKEILARTFQANTAECLPDGSWLIQRHELSDGWSRILNEWTLIKRGQTQTWKFEHSIYSGRELQDRLELAGFGNVKLFGSFQGDAYDQNALRLIAVARRLK